MKRRIIVNNRLGTWHGKYEDVEANTLSESVYNIRQFVAKSDVISILLDNGSYLIIPKTILQESLLIIEEEK